MDTDKKETTDLAKADAGETALQVAPPSPLMGIIAAASTDGNVDADKLMKLLEANERYEQNEARKAYHVAMAAFKANPPKIIKDKDNKQYGSKYASLPNVTDTISSALSEHGLSASWKTNQKENGWPEVTCFITHIYGHSESTALSAPPDDSGAKNAIQKIKSTITYLEQITLLALTGLATYDEVDDDGNGAGNGAKGPPEPTEEEQKALDAMCDCMVDSVPEGLVLDRERVKVVTHAIAGGYSDGTKSPESCAKYIIEEIKKNDNWPDAVCKKP